MATGDIIDDLHGMSGAYALDALDPDERARYEDHLATCAECREEVDGFRETAVLLAVVAALEAPPAALRDRVLDGITRIQPLPPEAVPAPRTEAGSHRRDAVAETETPAETNVVPLRRTPRRWVAVGLAAAVALVIGIGVGVVQPWHRQGSQQVAASTVDRVIADPNAQHVVKYVGGGRVEIVRSQSVGKAVAIFTGVHNLRGSRVYQLWLVDAGSAPVSAGVVSRGQADRTVVLKGNASSAIKAALSREPAGGSKTPSGQPVFFTLT